MAGSGPDAACGGVLPLIAGREDRCAVFSAPGDPFWTRAELRARALVWADRLTAPRGLCFLLSRNDPDSLAALLGAFAAGHVVTLLDAGQSPETIGRLTEAYQPDFVLTAREAGEITLETPGASGASAPVPAGPALLLSTSGTTGSAKCVRLSLANLLANADQIATALAITWDDIAAAHLPMHYSYGLSVLTSHLRAGAAVHLWPDSIAIPEFWTALARSGATHMPGVPFHYEFLARGGIAKLAPPTLKTFTQAGGPLNPKLQTRVREAAVATGARFYVMYGQTEAAPRITTLPHERLPEKLGSVGVALDGGRLSILGEDGQAVATGETGRVVYEGPNVMLGYAEARTDLGLPDQMAGRLETGDLGWLDPDGYLFLAGRQKRIAKPFGLRISLDDVERRFEAAGAVAAIEDGGRIRLFTPAPAAVQALVPDVAAEYKAPNNLFEVKEVPELPRLASGKTDYAQLKAGG